MVYPRGRISTQNILEATLHFFMHFILKHWHSNGRKRARFTSCHSSLLCPQKLFHLRSRAFVDKVMCKSRNMNFSVIVEINSLVSYLILLKFVLILSMHLRLSSKYSSIHVFLLTCLITFLISDACLLPIPPISSSFLHLILPTTQSSYSS
jgi:hypothetical protein